MSLAIKKFNLSYKQDILKLHKISFKKSKSSTYWDWRFNNKCLDVKTNDCILYMNVDPYPNNKNMAIYMSFLNIVRLSI